MWIRTEKWRSTFSLMMGWCTISPQQYHYANGILWVATYFGMSRYDGTHWKGYFDHDSGLASNFINFVKANGDVAFICTDEGLSSFNSEEWISYKKNGQRRTTALLQGWGNSTTKLIPPGSPTNLPSEWISRR